MKARNLVAGYFLDEMKRSPLGQTPKGLLRRHDSRLMLHVEPTPPLPLTEQRPTKSGPREEWRVRRRSGIIAGR